MKRWMTVAATMLAMVAATVCAQTVLSSQLQYTWTTTTATATGQLGNYVVLNSITAPRPAVYAVDWTVSGTAPSACTFHAQGSSDGATWFNVDGSSAISCTASGAEFMSANPVLYLRINLATYTKADNTTAVAFHYTGAPR